jgi:hypothetical protein
VISAASANAGRIVVSGSGIDLAQVSGVAGTYFGFLTVDAFGRISAVTTASAVFDGGTF